MKFIHAADIHLDSPLKGLERYEGAPVDEIRSATRRAFENLVNLAIDEQVGFVLIAGDLYDGDWKDYNTGLFFIDCMMQLDRAGIAVFIVSGNHDAASQITKVLRLPKNVTLFSSKSPQTVLIESLDVAIHGMSFPKRAVMDDLSEKYPQAQAGVFNIGLLHTCLDGKAGHEPYAPCSVENLKNKGYQYWALGHVHRREIISEEPWIVFSGNIQGRHIRESGAKGCTLVTVEAGEVKQLEHRDLDVMRWFREAVDISGCMSVDDVYEKVKNALQNRYEKNRGKIVAIRLTLSGICQAHCVLHANFEHWLQEFRALSIDVGQGDIWLEKVLLNSEREMILDEALEHEGALGGLLSSIQKLEMDDEILNRLGEEFTGLKKKIPAELLTQNESIDPTSHKNLNAALEDVKELLMARLLKKGAGS